MGKPNDDEETTEARKKRMKPLKVIALILSVVAIVKELLTPPSERTWHGEVIGFVPYDFRPPTIDRIKSTYWNPDGPIVSGRVFGVGWTVNVGALWNLIRP